MAQSGSLHEFLVIVFMCFHVTSSRATDQNLHHFHREPEHLISNKNKCSVIYLCPCVFFESFRRDLNEAKRVAYISKYNLICAF